jgi:ribosomal protein L7Ae-like RNA K-turn-binding protein
MIGLAMKAGKIGYGADMCEDKIKNKEAYLIIIAEDVSNNTKDKFIKLASLYNISIVIFGEIDSLSKSIGKSNKGVFVVSDEGFSNKILQMVKELKGANK